MIRIGIIGCGRIVELGHVPAFVTLKKLFRIVSIADPSPDRVRLTSELLTKAGLPAPSEYADYKEMIRLEELDAVDMALPHFLHHEAVLTVAKAGISIITEKPLATSVAEAKAMISTCRQARLPLILLHNYLYAPGHAKALELIRAGAIGKPFLYRSEGVWGGHWPGTDSYDPDWRTKSKKAGV
jgi:predicted dehydrogenase